MIAIRLPPEIEERLENLAKATGRTKTYYVREAILQYLEDMEDTYLALQRFEKKGKRYSMEEVKEELGLAD
jgi:RHH-type rel operon transcriptional repressor/antitoxin RelB